MKSSKNLVIFLLALTTIGGAALAWHQYQELVGLRAAFDPNERADLQKRLAALQKANHDLADELAAARSQSGDNEEEMAAGDQPSKSGPNDRNATREARRAEAAQRFAAFREVMARPDVQALMATEQKGALDSRYGALFRSLNLTPDQAGKLTDLLLERQNAQRDVMQAAREQGINPRTDPEGFNKLLTDAQSPINDSIKSLIGDNGYSQLANYDQTMPQRNLVNTLQQRLSYSDSPLTPAQADQLVQILASNTPAAGNATGADANAGRRADFGGGRMVFGGGGMGAIGGLTAAPITTGAVSQAQTVLSQTQLTALQQLQQQQQTAQQLQQLIRSATQPANGSGTTGGTNAAGRRRGGG